MTTLPQVQQQEALPAVAPRSTMDMVSDALARGAPMEMVERLLALHERWESAQAKKAFIEAKAAFKAEAPAIIKDRENKQFGSKYSSIGNLVTTTNEVLSKHGLDASWTYEQGEKGVIKVICKLQHILGHSESVELSSAPDATGSKNPIQQIKSATTYLKVATYEAVTGIASNEANMNDDGNAAYDKKEIKFRSDNEVLMDFAPGSPMESIPFDELKMRCISFINTNSNFPEMLTDWCGRTHNLAALRQLHGKNKSAAIAIRKRLDEVVALAREQTRGKKTEEQAAA